jgi:peptidoglycan/LPS O-acetylase OafA/YrhL
MKTVLDRPTSIYLNAVRFGAAMVVFLGHLAGHRFTYGFLWPIAMLKDQAVMIFFILSGFVIAYVTDDHERDLRTYAINRAARIYSVALPALVVAFILDQIGMRIRPDLYSQDWGFSDKNVWLQYLLNFFFLGRIWFNQIEPGSVKPYWSLGYEVWYYIIFASFFFLRGKNRIILGLLACFVAGPNILEYMPVWLLGFLTYRFSKSRTMPQPLSIGIIAATAVALIAYLGIHHVNEAADTALAKYGIGIVFAANLVAFQGLGKPAQWILPLEKPIAWLSGMTFSLYLFHVPVATFLTTLIPWPLTSAISRVVLIGGTFLVVAALAEVTERRKKPWRNMFSWLFAKFSEPSIQALNKAA